MKNKIIKMSGIIVMLLIIAACGTAGAKKNRQFGNQPQETPVVNVDNEIINDNVNINEVTDDVTDDTVIEEKTILEKSEETQNEQDKVIDLTLLSSTMVYSEVYNMMVFPQEYVGKTVKMKGMFVVYTNQEETMFYPAVIIADATACCSQGLEFLLEGNPPYPEAYPELDTEVTVVGTFETYDENGNMYCRLQNSKIVE